jgi:hypothetical protein
VSQGELPVKKLETNISLVDVTTSGPGMILENKAFLDYNRDGYGRFKF